MSDDPRAALADALGDLAATLRFHRDLGLEHLELEGEYLKSPADALRAQEQALQGCRRCKLCEGRNTIVFGSGNPQADLVVIGEGPGADEDAQGLPFVGRAGQLLTRMLASVDLTREECFITNTVLCRPPNRFCERHDFTNRRNTRARCDRGLYDLLQKTFLSETLTTSARSGRLGFVNLSWVRRRRAANTINISGGTALFERKLLLDLHANYDEKASRLLERGLRVGYYSQCCGFIAEYDRRDFFGIQRQEFRFIVDLKGIGKFLDLNAGTTP